MARLLVRFAPLASLALLACDGAGKAGGPGGPGGPDGPGGGDCVEATVYDDLDGDTFGDPSTGRLGCEGDRGTVLNGDDCNDTDPRIFPLNPEVCINDLDEDCDGVADDGCHVDWCGDLTDDTVWEGHLIHDVTCTVSVGGDAVPTLTVEDGAQVFFSPGAALSVGEGGRGALQVEGGELGVFLSPADDATAPGSWPGLRFGALDQGSTMTGAILSSAGETDAAVVAAGASPTLTDVLVQDSGAVGVLSTLGAEPSLVSTSIERSATHGVSVGDGASAVVQLSRIADSGEHGVFVDYGGCLADSRGFAGNAITGSGANPVLIPADCAGSLDDTTDYTGNADDRIRITGDQNTDGIIDPDVEWPVRETWTDPGVPYVTGAQLTVEDLTLEPGVELQFETYSATGGVWSQLHVLGLLTADGALLTSEEETPGPGTWRGIRLGDYDGSHFGSVTLTDTTVEWHEGVSGYGAATLERSVLQDARRGISALRVSVVDSTIQRLSDDDAAIAVGTTGSGLTLRGSTITSCAGRPLTIEAHLIDAVEGDNDLSGNATDEILVVNGDRTRSSAHVETTTTWRDVGAVWRLQDSVIFYAVVGGTQVVTFEDGVDIVAERDVRIAVGSRASIVVDGHTEGVTMSSVFGSAADLWTGLLVGGVYGDYDHENSRIDGLTVRNANTALLMGRAAPISNSTFSGNRVGLSIEGLDSVTDSVFSDNTIYGVDIRMDTDVAVNPGGFARNTVTGNGAAGTLAAAVVPALDGSNAFTGNDEDVLSVSYSRTGGALRDPTWADVGVPYRVEGWLRLDNHSRGTWTVEPGVTLLLDPGVSIYTDGLDIDLQGTASAPIVFTSAEAAPAAGDWDYLWLRNCSSATLAHVQMQYGGSGLGMLFLSSCDTTVTDSVFADSADFCIETGGTTALTLSDTTFSSCAAGDTD